MSKYFIIKDKGGNIKITSTSYLIKMVGRNPKFHPDMKLVSISNIRSDSRKTLELRMAANDIGNFYEVSSKKLHNICSDFMKVHSDFEWIIDKYCGLDKMDELIELALTDNYDKLFKDLDDIYWDLPDHIFNIRENPDGFEQLLWIVDNDDYKNPDKRKLYRVKKGNKYFYKKSID